MWHDACEIQILICYFGKTIVFNKHEYITFWKIKTGYVFKMHRLTILINSISNNYNLNSKISKWIHMYV